MKNKVISIKIEALGNRIKSIKLKAENANILKESGTFKSLESGLEAATVLQKEVQTLKDSLKAKSQELKEQITKLKKDSKETGKILRKEKKSIKPAGKKKNQDEKSAVLSKVSGTRKKKTESKKKSVKNKK